MSQQKIALIEGHKSRLERQLAGRSTAALKPTLKWGAMLDLYYLYALDRSQEGTNLTSRVYDRKHNDFTMNLIELNVEGQVGDLSLYADLDFGDFADQNQAHGGDGINHHIGQAFLTYNFSDQLHLSAGKMYTHVGYEVAKAQENWNYSRSFAFTLGGPFWHEGVALKYAHESGVSGGLYVYDNSDSSNENNREKTYGAQLGFANERFHFLFNVISGPEGTSNSRDKTVFEFNTQYAFADSLALALNGVWGSDEMALTPASGTTSVDKEWSAWVLYLHWQALADWAFTPRFEIFSDQSSGAATNQYIFSGMGATQAIDVTAFTLTSSYRLNEQSELRLEFRRDQADQNIWTDKKGVGQDELTTLSVAWLVKI